MQVKDVYENLIVLVPIPPQQVSGDVQVFKNFVNILLPLLNIDIGYLVLVLLL